MLMTCLPLSLALTPKEAAENLNQCLEEVTGWMRVNKLKINPDKTAVLLVGPNLILRRGMTLVLSPKEHPLQVHTHSLGVLLDDQAAPPFLREEDLETIYSCSVHILW